MPGRTRGVAPAWCRAGFAGECPDDALSSRGTERSGVSRASPGRPGFAAPVRSRLCAPRHRAPAATTVMPGGANAEIRELPLRSDRTESVSRSRWRSVRAVQRPDHDLPAARVETAPDAHGRGLKLIAMSAPPHLGTSDSPRCWDRSAAGHGARFRLAQRRPAAHGHRAHLPCCHLARVVRLAAGWSEAIGTVLTGGGTSPLPRHEQQQVEGPPFPRRAAGSS